jgi:hypothetical protein
LKQKGSDEEHGNNREKKHGYSQWRPYPMTDKQEFLDWFEQMFADMERPESKLKFERKNQFEREVLYAGLPDLNTGFDSDLIGHFSPEDFLTVIDRCEPLAVQVIGIEVFTTNVELPAKAGLEDIEISPVPGYDWARRLVRKYMERTDITSCATFDVPDALLNPKPKQKGESNS